MKKEMKNWEFPKLIEDWWETGNQASLAGAMKLLNPRLERSIVSICGEWAPDIVGACWERFLLEGHSLRGKGSIWSWFWTTARRGAIGLKGGKMYIRKGGEQWKEKGSESIGERDWEMEEPDELDSRWDSVKDVLMEMGEEAYWLVKSKVEGVPYKELAQEWGWEGERGINRVKGRVWWSKKKVLDELERRGIC